MKEDTGLVVLLITTPGEVEAERISQALLNQKMVACANIVPAVNSAFWWQGKLESARESLLIIKTKATLLPEIIRLVKRLHSYEVPEIIALPIIGGNQDYLNWVTEVVK